MRRLTIWKSCARSASISKPPMRRLTGKGKAGEIQNFSKPPVRRLTPTSRHWLRQRISKPPVRRLTAIYSPGSLIPRHLAPIILPFSFFLCNHKIPYYNDLHNLDIKNRIKFDKHLFLTKIHIHLSLY